MSALHKVELSWLNAAIAVGVLYGLIGIVFALPAAHVQAWRLLAWLCSAVVYMAHLIYEQSWLHSRVLKNAAHVAFAVALGAFILAAKATIHAALFPSNVPRWRFGIALGAWPIITAVPAFLAGIVFAFFLGRLSGHLSDRTQT